MVGVREVAFIVDKMSPIVDEVSFFDDMNSNPEIRMHIGPDDSKL